MSRGDDEVARLRVPPHSIEAEQSVLGGLLLDNSAWDRAADLLTESDFYRFEHRGTSWVVKDFGSRSFLVRNLIGRLLVRREVGCLIGWILVEELVLRVRAGCTDD